MLPYVLPIFSFLLVLEIEKYLPDEWALTLLVLRVLIPAAILFFFYRRGAYSELKLRVGWMSLADLSIGVALAAVWITPYLLFPAIRPEIEGIAFAPDLAGDRWVPIVLSLRMIGYAIVTPLVEELFMRSFLMRYADVFDTDEDFKQAPIGRYRLRSFVVVVIVFLATHMMWEWWVMVPWAVLTNLWFYFRKDLFAIVLVHAATNASILFAAIASSYLFSREPNGLPSLWFFV